MVDLEVVNPEAFKNSDAGFLDVEGRAQLRLGHAVHLPDLYRLHRTTGSCAHEITEELHNRDIILYIYE